MRGKFKENGMLKRNLTNAMSGLVALALAAVSFGPSQAETRVTYKSAKTGSSYYQMAVQIAEAMKAGSDGEIIVTVEESQGSVQNVMEVKARGADYVFTTPPSLVSLAQGGKAMFEGKGDPKFDEIRALFPLPSLTMHFVMSEKSGAKSLTDLEGKTILLGKGSFGATEGEKYVQLFGLEGKVTIADAELSNAVAALKNGQIDGFVTAGSYPAPNVIEAAAGTGVTVLSLSDDQIGQTKRTKLVIPVGTYPGQDAEITTTSLPVVAYTTTAMAEDVAYQLTKTFWDQKAKMGQDAAWWKGVDQALLANIEGRIHPGALKYYQEAGFPLADAHK
jgi:TRAP transporter TAXI family solute receptor